MSDSATKSSNRGHRAGIFDIRNIIGALLGIDGLIILLVGIFVLFSKIFDVPTPRMKRPGPAASCTTRASIATCTG